MMDNVATGIDSGQSMEHNINQQHMQQHQMSQQQIQPPLQCQQQLQQQSPQVQATCQQVNQSTLLQLSQTEAEVPTLPRKGRSNNNCCVVGCKNTYSTAPGISFYSFPNEKYYAERRQKWIRAVNRVK